MTPKIVILMGGLSAERDISLSTGYECAVALRNQGYHVVQVDAQHDIVERLLAEGECVVFNALHGRWGEDGCVQGILEYLRIPYTHSGVLSSALTMDKQSTKDAYRSVGLPVVNSMLISKEEVCKGLTKKPPYVVKPNNEGSSIGIFFVKKDSNFLSEMSDELPDVLLVEDYAVGRELTTAVMGDRALTVTEIETDGWYDYDAKYTLGLSQHIVPAKIPVEIFDACLDFALRAHQVLKCRGVSRTDFRWDDTKGLEGLVLLETNTQPGMTPTSLVPEQAKSVGINFGQLCQWIVEDSSCDR